MDPASILVERHAQRAKTDRLDAIRLHAWLLAQRQHVPDGSATAKAIDYSLGRWGPLTHYLDDGAVPIDNNWVETRSGQLRLAKRIGYLPGA